MDTGKEELRNIIVILADCLRFDTAEAKFDWLWLSGGIKYTNCWATAGATIPSAISALTGLLPSEHGVVMPGMKPLVPTLDQMAREWGYNAYTYTENPHTRWLGDPLAAGVGIEVLKSYGTQALTQPWFVLYHNMTCHFPYRNHPRSALTGKALNPYLMTKDGTTRPELQTLRAAYELSAIRLAGVVGEMLDNLREHNPIVILFSDHGECFKLTRIGHQGWWWDNELLHVPLIVHDGRRGIAPEVVSSDISVTWLPDIVKYASEGMRRYPRSGPVYFEDYQGPDGHIRMSLRDEGLSNETEYVEPARADWYDDHNEDIVNKQLKALGYL